MVKNNGQEETHFKKNVVAIFVLRCIECCSSKPTMSVLHFVETTLLLNASGRYKLLPNMQNLLFVFLIFAIARFSWSLSFTNQMTASAPMVSSLDDTTVQGVEGFAVGLRCTVNTCVKPDTMVTWKKGNIQISQGSLTTSDKYSVRVTVQFSSANMEFKLTIYNLTIDDASIYTCSLQNSNNVTTRLVVVEGTIDPEFSKNFTYDHRTCCQRNGMSDECMPMCRPGLIESHKFETHTCYKEFDKLLRCATNEGKVSHEHCCMLETVPRYCMQYCTASSYDFSKANKLCIYYMPEILSCYERAYLPFPGQPERLRLFSLNDSSVRACWDRPILRGGTVQYYTVNYQELPQFSFFNGLNLFGANQGPVSEADVPQIASNGAPLSPGGRRKKRQTLFITTHNLATNETETREYKYQRINTTDTCLTISNLKSSTRYFVYVTATNSYGTSMPSVKQAIATKEVSYSDRVMPDVLSCCKSRGVDDACASKMCDLKRPPSAMGSFELSFTCRKDFDKVSPCLADGRDHTECCREKGVYGACLKFCDGTAEPLAMSNILCMTLDIQAIFSCYKRGYVTLPSAPTNLTVYDVDANTAYVSWTAPISNPDLVQNYSLFYGKNSMIELRNAKSPYRLQELQADSLYSVYVVARGDKGSSLRSATASFQTQQPDGNKVCQYGRPLLDGSGKRVLCSSINRCPSSYQCLSAGTSDTTLRYCCPSDTTLFGPTNRVQPPNVTACCASKKVSKECMPLCSYQTTRKDLETLGLNCLDHIQAFVDCGGDGRNNGECCRKRQLSSDSCMDFCTPPLRKKMEDYVDCLDDAEKIIACGLDGVLYRPGPPTDIHIVDQGADWFTAAWRKPTQSVTVKFFEIMVNGESKANVSGLLTTVDQLTSDANYEVKVISWNERGSSMPSDTRIVSLRSRSIDWGLSCCVLEQKFLLALENHDVDKLEDLIMLAFPINLYQEKVPDKPRPPDNIRKVSYSNGRANITWDWSRMSVRGNPIRDVNFIVHYMEHTSGAGPNLAWKNTTTTNYYVVLDNLVENQSYDIYVTAVNTEKGVSSASSATFVINATEVDRTSYLDLFFNPNGYATNVGYVNYTFPSVSIENGTEAILCIVNDDGQITTKREGATASMACFVRGFPIPKVEWSNVDEKNAKTQIQTDSRHFVLSTYADDYILHTLDISSVQVADAGSYSCGACNEVGCSVKMFLLVVDPLESPAGPDTITDCCKLHKVKDKCLPICSSQEARESMEEDEDCTADYYKYFQCSKASIDSSQCCSFKGVPDLCLPYCHLGEMMQGDRDTIENIKLCTRYHKQIIHCTRSEHKKFMPETLSITNVTKLGSRRLNIVSKSPYALVSNIDSSKQYNLTIICKNAYGYSTFPIPYTYSPIVLNDESKISQSSTSGGVIFLIILLLLLIVSAALSFVYFSRRPEKMPSFMLNALQRKNAQDNGAVAFENPGYDTEREGRVHGLPGDPIVPSTNVGARTNGYANAGYESAQLETPPQNHESESNDSKQNNGKYAQLIS
uniref:Ig-like and fibronectin type-III domain-containing protein C25G4.10 n=1 Tax=Romanomermis culicivorax TaxID=13658 RepID=A0A915K9V9_ROMCU